MIRYGRCRNSHETVIDVKTCYAGDETSVRLVGRSSVNSRTDTALPATTRQVNYVLDLARRRDITELSVGAGVTLDKIRDNVTAIECGEPEPFHVIRPDASHLIGELLDCTLLPETWKITVPDGRYAVTLPVNSRLRFFHVTRTKTGSLKIRERAGDVLHEKRFTEYRKIIEAILDTGVESAGRRYGRELGHCWKCGLTLTNQISRAFGEGPVCRDR